MPAAVGECCFRRPAREGANKPKYTLQPQWLQPRASNLAWSSRVLPVKRWMFAGCSPVACTKHAALPTWAPRLQDKMAPANIFGAWQTMGWEPARSDCAHAHHGTKSKASSGGLRSIFSTNYQNQKRSSSQWSNTDAYLDKQILGPKEWRSSSVKSILVLTHCV